MAKLLSEIKKGDKIYIYSFYGEAKVEELEVENVGEVNSANHFPVYFKGSSLFDVFIWKYSEYFFRDHQGFLYSTIGNLTDIFQKILDQGENNRLNIIKGALGLEV